MCTLHVSCWNLPSLPWARLDVPWLNAVSHSTVETAALRDVWPVGIVSVASAVVRASVVSIARAAVVSSEPVESAGHSAARHAAAEASAVETARHPAGHSAAHHHAATITTILVVLVVLVVLRDNTATIHATIRTLGTRKPLIVRANKCHHAVFSAFGLTSAALRNGLIVGFIINSTDFIVVSTGIH